MSETILAAMIGALATVCTAMFQLVLAWRNAGKPERKASGGMRSLVWTLALLGAAAVGGFAYAEYRAQNTRGDTALLREELHREIELLAASTARLERFAPGTANAEDAAQQRGLDGVAAAVTLPPCKGSQVGFATERTACSEHDALQIAVCTPVPTGARVTAVELFVRPDDSQQPWSAARVTAGKEVPGGRFAATHLEPQDEDGNRQVCQAFSHWGDKGRTVRILVRYVL